MSNADRRYLRHRWPPALALMTAALAGGCQDEAPTQQVVATVAGVDITKRDLAAEASFGGRSAPSDAAMRGPVLADIVDRQLLVERARRLGLDRTPGYLAEVRRLRDVALAETMAREIVAPLAAPSAAEARRYVETHQRRFDGRTLFLVDAKALGGRQWIDGLPLSDDTTRRLGATKIGDRVSLDDRDPGSVQLLARRPAPLTGAAAQRAAVRLLGEERARNQVHAAIDEERRSADIRYQPGFGPGAR